MASRQMSTSPLRKFVDAKNRINVIFGEIEKYVQDAVKLLRELQAEQMAISQQSLQEVEQFSFSISTMKDVLLRDKMKVAFFGRTSNGKSTVINAMLHSKILPSGMGHTTRCFVQVEGSLDNSKAVLTEDSDEMKSIESLDSLAHALRSKEMGEDSLVRILWPKTDSKLLQNEVVLLDSPGIDVSPQFDIWIDKHCLDADVFVLVSNAESTLTQTEKNFFHRVNDKLSRPNIFILNNRWDASAIESDMVEQVREQHVKTLINFLVNDLAVYSSEDVKQRIFFVSAKEALWHRLKLKGASVTPAYVPTDGFQARLLEFDDFERQFELCISQSAIQSKFESHLAKAKHLATRVFEVMEDVYLTLMRRKDECCNAIEGKSVDLAICKKSFNTFVDEASTSIRQLAAEVRLQVSAECYEEITRLQNVINSFHKPFMDDAVQVHLYKQELLSHVDQVLTDELQLRCTGGLLQGITGKEKEMVDNAAAFLPPNYDALRLSLLQHREPFKFAFALHCHSLLSDFQEDLRFSFSLGLHRLVSKFMQVKYPAPNDVSQRISKNEPDLFSSASLIPKPVSTSSPVDRLTASSADQDVVHSIVYTSAMYVANGGVGVLIMGSFIYKSIGWRYIALGASAYVLLYLFERFRWNDRSKERCLKNQMTRHLCFKLHQQSQTISANCENQVVRETTEVLNRLQEFGLSAQSEMKQEISAAEEEAKSLDRMLKKVAHTKNSGKFVCSELDTFWNTHLKALFAR